MKATHKAITGALLGGALLLTTACGGGNTRSAGPDGASKPAASPTSAARVTITPADGATGVKPAGALKVAVAAGKLSTVKVTGPDGADVPGTVSADGTGWEPSGRLSVGSKYQVSVQAADDKGVPTSARSSFTTLTPQADADPHDNLAAGQTVGVGMIVRLRFGRSIKDRAAVEKAVVFEASDGTVVKPHWFNDQWVDFRPEHFWAAGTKVTIHYRLKSVEVAPGVYGGVDKDKSFTIARSQVSTVDAATHLMDVQRDGKPYQTIPISTGASEPQSWNAYNGIMVIEAKEGSALMDSTTVPGLEGQAYKEKVPHSMRLTDSGTYVHGNNWSPHSVFGHENVSHGCVGLEDAPGDQGDDNSTAGKFYADSIIGDVVTIKNSVGKQVAPDNGLSGWNVPWTNW